MSVFGFYFAKSDEAAACSASGDPGDDASAVTMEEHASCPGSSGPADVATASPSLEVQEEGSSADPGWRWLPDWQRWGHDTSSMMFDPHSGKYFVLNGTEMQEVEEKTEEVGEEVTGEWDGESLSGGEEDFSEGALEDLYGEGFDDLDDASHLVDLQTDKETAETVENGAEAEPENPDVCGDWIFDGEWWITAEGHSYHPVLKQLFHNGERVLSKVPVPLYPFHLVRVPRSSPETEPPSKESPSFTRGDDQASKAVPCGTDISVSACTSCVDDTCEALVWGLR